MFLLTTTMSNKAKAKVEREWGKWDAASIKAADPGGFAVPQSATV